MTKVQLQNKESVTQLRVRFAQAVEDYANVQTEWTTEQKRQFVQHLAQVGDKAMEILQRNVQINGKDWEDHDDALDAMEPIDKDLEEKLLGLQVEVNELLVEVANCRNEVPPLVAKAVAERLEHAKRQTPKLSSSNQDAEQLGSALNEEERGMLHSNMDAAARMLASLTRSLPHAVSRLQQSTA